MVVGALGGRLVMWLSVLISLELGLGLAVISLGNVRGSALTRCVLLLLSLI